MHCSTRGIPTWAWSWRSECCPNPFGTARPGTVNLHGSLLLVSRSGSHPLGRAQRETTTGASTFLLKHEIDTGHVLGKVEVPIGPDDTTGIVHDRLLESGKHLLVTTVDDLADGTAQPVPQSELTTEGERLNEAPKLFKEHGLIDWSRDAEDPQSNPRAPPLPGGGPPFLRAAPFGFTAPLCRATGAALQAPSTAPRPNFQSNVGKEL